MAQKSYRAFPYSLEKILIICSRHCVRFWGTKRSKITVLGFRKQHCIRQINQSFSYCVLNIRLEICTEYQQSIVLDMHRGFRIKIYTVISRRYGSCPFFFFLTVFYFTILYWFCHTSTWFRHRCTRVPNPEPPSHLPPYTISPYSQSSFGCFTLRT